MKELALHILDIAENSIRAHADRIVIEIVESEERNELTMTITDNGEGMDDETLSRVMDPFFTTKTVRRIGIGLSLLDQAARQTGGGTTIESTRGKGTRITARFTLDHVDRQPVGDLASTMSILIGGNPSIDFVLRHDRGKDGFLFETRSLREELGDVDLNEPEVLNFIAGLVRERRNLSDDSVTV